MEKLSCGAAEEACGGISHVQDRALKNFCEGELYTRPLAPNIGISILDGDFTNSSKGLCADGMCAASGGITHVPGHKQTECMRALRDGELDARLHAPNTARAYGDTTYMRRGPPKEWEAWCRAGPCVVVYGVVTQSSKVIYNTLVTPEKVELFLLEHLTKRPMMTSTEKVGLICNIYVHFCLKLKRKMYDYTYIVHFSDIIAFVPEKMFVRSCLAYE